MSKPDEVTLFVFLISGKIQISVHAINETQISLHGKNKISVFILL